MHLQDHRPPGLWRRALSGGVLLGFGLALLFVAWGYPVGRLTQMGPGYVPRIVGALICLLALIIIVVDVTDRQMERAPGMHWRGLAFVSASILLFAAMIEPLGLIPSIFAACVVSMLADDRARPLGVLVFSLLVTLGAWGLFIGILELPIPAFWR